MSTSSVRHRTEISIEKKLEHIRALRALRDEKGGIARYSIKHSLNPKTAYKWASIDPDIFQEKTTTLSKKAFRLNFSFAPIVDEALYIWFMEVRASSPGIPITDTILLCKANKLAIKFASKNKNKDNEAENTTDPQKLPEEPPSVEHTETIEKEHDITTTSDDPSSPYPRIPQFDGLNDEDSPSSLFEESSSPDSSVPESGHFTFPLFPDAPPQIPAGITLPPGKRLSEVEVPHIASVENQGKPNSTETPTSQTERKIVHDSTSHPNQSNQSAAYPTDLPQPKRKASRQ